MCGEIHPTTGRPCSKPPGHWRFRDHRRLHHVEIPHTGAIRRTYKATHVYVWRTK